MTFRGVQKTKCPGCGAEFDDPVIFCGVCGKRIAAQPAPSSPSRVGAPLDPTAIARARAIISRPPVTAPAQASPPAPPPAPAKAPACPIR